MAQKWSLRAISGLREFKGVSRLVNLCLAFKIVPLFMGKGLETSGDQNHKITCYGFFTYFLSKFDKHISKVLYKAI